MWAAAGRVIDRWHLDPAIKRNRQHPNGSPIPDEEDEKVIESGMFIKLSFTTSDVWGRPNWGEAMWVEVVAVEKRHIVGVLSNQPIGIPRLDMGDKVKFKRHHIIDIVRDADDLRDLYAWWCRLPVKGDSRPYGSDLRPPLDQWADSRRRGLDG